MKQIRAERPKRRRDRADAEIFPLDALDALDARDPEIVRAKALTAAARRPTARSTR